MKWENDLYDKCTEVCNVLGYPEAEYVDEVYNIFHELLELDENSEEYRRKISQRRREGITDLLIDTFGNKEDPEKVVNYIFKKMDCVPKE